MFRRLARGAVLGACIPLSMGCYATHAVEGPQIARLHQGDRIVQSVEGSGVNVGPNSNIRFWRNDGSVTPWVRADSLLVSEEGVLMAGSQGDGLRWSDVQWAEVNEVSGTHTLLIVAASGILVAGVAVLIAAAAAGGDGGSGNWDCGGCSGVYCGGWGGGGGSHAPPPPEGTLESRGFDDAHPPTRGLTGPALYSPGFNAPLSGSARSMFTADERRRADIKFTVAIEGGVLAGRGRPGGEFYQSVDAGIRLNDVVDLGVGVSRLGFEGDPLLSSEGAMPIGHVGVHCNLDPRHVVAMPLAIEGGALADGSAEFRLVWGLRFQVSEMNYVAIYPLNPTVRRYVGPQTDYWVWPTTFELGATF